MNIYEKYEFLVNNGWKFAERKDDIFPYIFTHPKARYPYTHKDLEFLINYMYITVSDKNEYL